MKIWLLYPFLLASSGLLIFVVRCALGLLAKHPPKILAGAEGGVSNLAAALAASVPYSIIEIAPGVHEGAGWTGLHLPAHPVLITSPDAARAARGGSIRWFRR